MVKRKQDKDKAITQNMEIKIVKSITRKDIGDKDNGNKIWEYFINYLNSNKLILVKFYKKE